MKLYEVLARPDFYIFKKDSKMPFFKYYRPNVYFEKAIRYNELYFSANSELNDPHDLKGSYFFEDSVELWGALLKLQPEHSTWDLDVFVDVGDPSLSSALNDLFKAVTFDSITGSLWQIAPVGKPRLWSRHPFH